MATSLLGSGTLNADLFGQAVGILQTALTASASLAPALATDITMDTSLAGSATLAPRIAIPEQFATALVASATMQGGLATDVLLAATLLAAAYLDIPGLAGEGIEIAAALTASASLAAAMNDLPVGVGALTAALAVLPDFSATLSTLPDLVAKLQVSPDASGDLTTR